MLSLLLDLVILNAIIPEFSFCLYTEITPHNSVIATVGEVPSSESSGRLLLFLNSFTDGLEKSNSKRAKKNTHYTLGSLVEAEVGQYFVYHGTM